MANNIAAFEIRNSDEFMMAMNFAYGVGTVYQITDSYGTMVDCCGDQCVVGTNVNIGTRAWDNVAMYGCRFIPSALGGQSAQANCNAIIYGGSGGTKDD